MLKKLGFKVEILMLSLSYQSENFGFPPSSYSFHIFSNQFVKHMKKIASPNFLFSENQIGESSVLVMNQKTIISEELELPNIPKRSRLYHLEPIAMGTPYGEGLVSYICRLAETHCVSAGILIQKEILPSFRESYNVGIGEIYVLQKDGNTLLVSSLPKPPYRENPNEYGLLAWQYLEGLKGLTLRLDLQTLIISPKASRALSEMAASRLGRELRAWCPQCFQTWHDAEQPIYEPLLWSITAITVCPCHHTLIQTRCPHCQKTQRPLTSRTCVARCSQCFGWLGICMEEASKLKLLTTAEFEKQLRIAEQVMKSLDLV